MNEFIQTVESEKLMPYLWHEQKNKSTKETENMYIERSLSTWEGSNE